MELLRTDTFCGFGVAVATPSGPLPLHTVLAIGRNYADHAKEQGAAVPDRPMVFMKNPAALALHAEDIIVPAACRDPSTGGPAQVDFEAELAVIIGRPVKDASPAAALDAILGYCCANDVSARWWQKTGSGGQFCRGKSFDTFCPLGPRVVPASDFNPADARVLCRVNGTVMQDARTSQMMFGAVELVAELSRGTTLLPGTVLLTGTPAGVGMARTPPVWLAHHDVVEIEIEGLGTLRNRVIDA